MSLIKSISGIRGTIGGRPGEGLTPLDVVRFTAAYAAFIRRSGNSQGGRIVVGRDARTSGPMVNSLVTSTLVAMGFDVVDIGLASTPTVEIAVVGENACGGIILTASHNPSQWNALKLLNHRGEFLNDAEGKAILKIAASDDIEFAPVDRLGTIFTNTTYDRRHIELVVGLPGVDPEAIRRRNLTVAVDAVNSVGGIIIPRLLRALGVENIIEINCTPDGKFAHNPEPIPANLTGISEAVRLSGADLGIVVDPDVDRLAIVMEGGEMFVEEYTLVSVADYVMSLTPGPAVSNLSSSRALRDVAHARGCSYSASAVGEVNVVAMMKQTGAVIGGEGNGGVIYPAAHYGRDALVGVALFLTLLAKSGKSVSALRAGYPSYEIVKDRIDLAPGSDIDGMLAAVKTHFAGSQITDIDGIKIDFDDSWVHLRRSNTEPIIRIYAEAPTAVKAQSLADAVKQIILATP